MVEIYFTYTILSTRTVHFKDVLTSPYLYKTKLVRRLTSPRVFKNEYLKTGGRVTVLVTVCVVHSECLRDRKYFFKASGPITRGAKSWNNLRSFLEITAQLYLAAELLDLSALLMSLNNLLQK